MNEALSIIRRSEILRESDIEGLNELQEELLDGFQHSQVFRTRYEMETSVLGDLKHPTADSKYWQSQREQQVMFSELVLLSYEYRKNIIEIKQLERKLQAEEDDLEQELLRIEIEKKTFISKNQERTAKDRIREIREWHDIKQRLLPHMKAGIEDCGAHQIHSNTLRYLNELSTITQATPPADRRNIESKALSAMRLCQEKGIKIEHPLLQAPDRRQIKEPSSR